MTFQANNFSSLTFTNTDICCHIIWAEQAAIHITFSNQRHQQAILWLHKKYPEIIHQPSMTAHPFCHRLEAYCSGRSQNIIPGPIKSPFIDHGTKFQQRVWGIIDKIPYGETRTYSELAEELGNRNFARAVGQACNRNPLALIIPCHRVISNSKLICILFEQ